jgi:hypothetical protein
MRRRDFIVLVATGWVLLFSDRQQPGLRNHRCGLGGAEEADQRSGGLGLSDVAGERARE